MKLALGLDVQTNAKGRKFMSIEDSHKSALVCKADVEVLWERGNFRGQEGRRQGERQGHVKCKRAASSGTPPATACRAPRSSRAGRRPGRSPLPPHAAPLVRGAPFQGPIRRCVHGHALAVAEDLSGPSRGGACAGPAAAARRGRTAGTSGPRSGGHERVSQSRELLYSVPAALRAATEELAERLSIPD